MTFGWFLIAVLAVGIGVCVVWGSLALFDLLGAIMDACTDD